MPPTVTTARLRPSSSVAFFSMIAWLIIGSFPSLGSLDRAHRPLRAEIALDSLPDVEGDEQRAGEVEEAAERTDQIVGMHRGDCLDERIDQEAELIVLAPHQALHDAGHPHRRGVENDADGGEPEVP